MNHFLLFIRDGDSIRIKTYLVDIPKIINVMYSAGYMLETIKDQHTD